MCRRLERAGLVRCSSFRVFIGFGPIGRGTVNKADVFAYLTGRKEDEIVTLPGRVTIEAIERVHGDLATLEELSATLKELSKAA